MDEVGRGTSTNDGLAIAQAVSEELIRRLGCRTLFATHFHELTAMEEPGMRNLSMRVAEEGREIIFLKKVVEGPSNNSYGIHVARLAGVPTPVVERAQELLEELLRRSGEETRRPAEKGAQAAKAQPRHTPGEGRREQASLFSEEELIPNELRGLNLDELTPLSALNLLAEWKRRLSR